ncbi:phosphate ABC transporter permease PstA [Pantoea phytobeneficialis]|uniref:Phosphate transport system permease protein PstA n=1 Tax=Pantoea phytobeneficialis TaxID=2052056 RepID=A0AAP9KQ44_9GAMM|nr:phosphate ABC transporter permease PstA [Pantoea phytobeneficialis]MDO6408979.1 phosphate ABC transporter permease PstA [Pantoea phytobeneficialis]QGR07482.1 phosphate ABC transporter, permease protein PstA [Pantoea phytobeneficialis]
MKAMRQNDRWRWLTAGAVAVCLLAFTLLIGLLAWQGMRAFWPQPVDLYQLQPPDGEPVKLLGETVQRQQHGSGWRYVVKTGNRDFAPPDFRVIDSQNQAEIRQPPDVMVLQRRSGGNAYGWFIELRENNEVLTARDRDALLHQRLKAAHEQLRQASQIRRIDMARLNAQLENLQQQAEEQQRKGVFSARRQSEYDANSAALQRRFSALANQLSQLQSESQRDVLVLRDVQGQDHVIPLAQIVAAWYPNSMSFGQKVQHFFSQVWQFVSNNPAAGESESGALPAIFGTVLMVLLMSVIVMPLGVVAALWLHEYAGRNALTRLVRIAVVNLAGVPSIVYGVFGLGFFVWLIGGTIDQLFYSRALPNPTFGTPGLLWAALTLALLTLPVVIVATEEGLSRIPDSLRQGSLALGATQAETLWRVVLPLAVPAMLTGLILAVARAAGETAPLMLVGVVKMVPELPVDAVFPYLHLDRKFMHLGFQIYDLAFQSPNIDADRPLVYATALLLVVIILSLNLLAMVLRHRLRERYRLMTH